MVSLVTPTSVADRAAATAGAAVFAAAATAGAAVFAAAAAGAAVFPAAAPLVAAGALAGAPPPEHAAIARLVTATITVRRVARFFIIVDSFPLACTLYTTLRLDSAWLAQPPQPPCRRAADVASAARTRGDTRSLAARRALRAPRRAPPAAAPPGLPQARRWRAA